MGIVYQKDKRTGITYAYESKSVWIKELKQSRATRRLIGKVDPETGEIVPTDGRGRKRSPDYNPAEEEHKEPITLKECQERIQKLEKEVETLKSEIAALRQKTQG